MSIEYRRKNYCYINQFDMVKATYMGNIVRVRNVERSISECPIVRLPNNKFKNKKTGEIKEFKPRIKNRSQGSISLSNTRRDIKDTITTNCRGSNRKRCMFITLTYEKPMIDTEKLCYDLNNFVSKFRYHYGKDVQYIMLPAPQIKRKEWSFHTHCIFIFKGKAPFIDNKDIQKLWKFGITNTQYKLYGNVDNLGAYFLAHLSDMPLDEVIELGLPYDEKDIKEVNFSYKDGKKLDKPLKIVKGIRTKYYPPNFKILRKSEGLDKPLDVRERYYETRKKVDYMKPTFKSTLQLIDKENNWSNVIKTEEYNLSRSNLKSKPTKQDLEAINYINNQQEKDKQMLNLTEDDYDF